MNPNCLWETYNFENVMPPGNEPRFAGAVILAATPVAPPNLFFQASDKWFLVEKLVFLEEFLVTHLFFYLSLY